MSQIIGGVIVASLAVAIVYAVTTGEFEAAPTNCSDFSATQINRVLANAPLAKLVSMKVLEIESTRDTGSTDSAHLKCDAAVFTTTGDQTLHLTTKPVNGTTYMTVSLF